MPPIRVKRSFLWLHFKEGINEATCNYCSIKLSTKNGSLGNLKRHLSAKHPTIQPNIERQPALVSTEPLANRTVPIPPQPQPSSSKGAAAAIIPSSSSLISNYIRKPPSTQKVDQIDRQALAMVVLRAIIPSGLSMNRSL